MAKPKKKVAARGAMPLYIISDSTGNLPRHMVTAFLTQFPPGTFSVRMETFVKTMPQLEDVLAKVAGEPGVIFHAVISPSMKKAIDAFCRKHKAACRDITGSFVDFLAEESGVTPLADARQLHSTGEAYHARIRALEFTLEHDDGLGLNTIHNADIVLAGVSRTSKTPTSIYLAQQGYRTANVALAIEVEPPAELVRLGPEKVVGLVIDPMKLVDIRSNRQAGWRMGASSYNDPEHVEKEIEWSKRLFRTRGWSILNITNSAIEETAARVVDLLHLRPPTDFE